MAWFAGIFVLARQARKYRLGPLIVYVAAMTVALAPFIWVGYAWSQFKDACSEIKPLTQFTNIGPQKSLLLRLDLDFDFGKPLNMDIGSILQRVGPVCIENEFWKPITDPQTGETFRFERRCGTEYSRSSESVSRYAVAVESTKNTSGLGYTLAYRVQNINGKRIIAEAQERVFGRGLLKHYIGLFSGSNNPEYLACGYVSGFPRIWRNSRVGVGDPEYDVYVRADQALFQIALGRTTPR